MTERAQDIPKYFVISQELTIKIKKGELKPGMKIPSENDIIKKYDVSNTTARKVLQEVEAAGLVTKIKGKGTFVNDSKVVRSASRILSFTKNMLQAGHKPSTKLLDARTVREGYSATINGRRYNMKGPVYKIHRLRFADTIPMMMETRYISLTLCPDIEKQDFEGSLYDLYEKKYHLHLRSIDQMLSTSMMDTGIHRFFDLKESIPAILVEGVTFCGKEMILEMEQSIYRGDKYRFSIRVQ